MNETIYTICAKVNELAEKYKFNSMTEIEIPDIRQWCCNILSAVHLGLDIEKEDRDFIESIYFGKGEIKGGKK